MKKGMKSAFAATLALTACFGGISTYEIEHVSHLFSRNKWAMQNCAQFHLIE